jgi:hypothetical protein
MYGFNAPRAVYDIIAVFVFPDKKRCHYAMFEDAVPYFPVIIRAALFQTALEYLQGFKRQAVFYLASYPYYPYFRLYDFYRAVLLATGYRFSM